MKRIFAACSFVVPLLLSALAAPPAGAAPPRGLQRWQVRQRVKRIARFARRRMSDSHWNRIVDVRRGRDNPTVQRRGNVTKLTTHDAQRGARYDLVVAQPPLLLRLFGLGKTTVRTRQRQRLDDGHNTLTTQVTSTETVPNGAKSRSRTRGELRKHTREGGRLYDTHQQRYMVNERGGLQLISP